MKRIFLLFLIIVMTFPSVALFATDGSTASMTLQLLKGNLTEDIVIVGVSKDKVTNSESAIVDANNSTILFKLDDSGTIVAEKPVYLYWQIFSASENSQFKVKISPKNMVESTTQEEFKDSYAIYISDIAGEGSLMVGENEPLYSTSNTSYTELYTTNENNRIDYGCVGIEFQLPNTIDKSTLSIKPYKANIEVLIEEVEQNTSSSTTE